MHPFIDVLLAEVEKSAGDGCSLADRLRDSFDPQWKSYDGALVDELTTMINGVLTRKAYNVVAKFQDVDLLEEDTELGGPYADIFLDEVLAAIGIEVVNANILPAWNEVADRQPAENWRPSSNPSQPSFTSPRLRRRLGRSVATLSPIE